MTTKVRTGDVFQRTKTGPNYIALGKAVFNGQPYVIAVKNGKIKEDGKAKIGQRIVASRSSKLGRKGTRPVLHAFKPTDIYRIHDNRHVDINSVWGLGNAVSLDQPVRRMNRRNGVQIEAKRLID